MLELAQWQVLPEWVDYNHHMNDAAYALVFSRSVDALMDRVGLDATGRERTGQTIYTLNLMIRYLREVKQGATVQVGVRILEMDARRLRLWLAMADAEGNQLATCEQLLLCVAHSGGAPKAASFVPEVAARLAEIARLHAGQAFPAHAGEGIALRRKPQG